MINIKTIVLAILLAATLVVGMVTQEKDTAVEETQITSTLDAVSSNDASAQVNVVGSTSSEGTTADSSIRTFEEAILDTADMFSDRDLEQTADVSEAAYIEISSKQEYIIDSEGVFVVSGEAHNVTLIVDADEEDKVQIVLDGVTIVNDDSPAIYIKSADKVFVTTTDSVNAMEVSGDYEADGDTNLDAVIFSKEDLVLNGIGTLEVVSYEGNGISSKDDLKMTGGTLNIAAEKDAIEANDSIRLWDGEITIVAGKDGLHSENDDDESLGYIYIVGGTITISSEDDAIHANSVIQIDGGMIHIETSSEGIEATYVQINAGDITIYATDDGINATAKSSAYDVVIEVNGGNINVTMASGDTDGFDANGDVILNGGSIAITGGSYIDADRSVEFNGGDLVVNGEVVTEIVQQQMGGKGRH